MPIARVSKRVSYIESRVIVRNGSRRRKSEVQVSRACGTAAARGTLQKADLHQIRLHNVFDRHGFLANGRRQRLSGL